jgi:hypothetical protein
MTQNGACEKDGASVTNHGVMLLDNAMFDNDLVDAVPASSIKNSGTLTMSASKFEHNAPAPGYAVLQTFGEATIFHSAFDHNDTLPILSEEGVLNIFNARISTNPGNDAARSPGAVSSIDATLILTGTTIDHNTGTIGGAVTTTSSLRNSTLTNDTITDNVTHYVAPSGAPNAHDPLPAGGVTNDATLMIRNTTIARNLVVGFHDWHYHAGGIVTMIHGYTALSNSIVANNVGDAPVRAQACYGPIHSLGYNIVDDLTDCDIGGAHNLFGISPALRPLAANGGFTMTSMPAWGSPAVDAGSPAPPNNGDATTCAVIDQRSAPRPLDGNLDGVALCDIGAVEHPGAP